MPKTSTCVLVLFALAGCAKDSEDLPTYEIKAGFTVELADQPTPGSTVVEAKLARAPLAGPGTDDPVNLSDGDSLSVTTDKGDDLPMPRVEKGEYRVTLPNVDRTTFTFHLKRSSGTSSDGSVLFMQPAMAFTDSPANKSYAATDMVHFAWSNRASGAKLFLSAVSRGCGGSGGINVGVGLGKTDVKDLPFDDSGSLDIAVSKLYSNASPASGDCVDIAIRRSVTSNAEGVLGSGSGVTGRRTERLTINVK